MRGAELFVFGIRVVGNIHWKLSAGGALDFCGEEQTRDGHGARLSVSVHCVVGGLHKYKHRP